MTTVLQTYDGATRAGTVYGVLLNDRRTLARLSPEFERPPYKASPSAPVLYIKPRNTHAIDGSAVIVPSDVDAIRIDATVGAVIGRRATRVTEEEALSHVAGYVVVSDLNVPHEVYYRPSIKHRCRDGFCPMGEIVPAADIDLQRVALRVAINGNLVQTAGFATMARSLPQLLVDVTEFMTLEAGDILLVGLQDDSPVARAGDTVCIDVTGIGSLTHSLTLEPALRWTV